MKQFVVVYKHAGKKLAHVGIYNTFLSNGMPNTNHQLARLINKAQYAHQCAIDQRKNHSFSHSIVPWLINTNYIGWTEETVGTDLELEEANTLKEKIASELDANDWFINIRLKNNTYRDPDNGTVGWDGKIPKSPNGLKNFLEKVTLGMEFRSPARKSSLMNDIHTLINYPNGSLRILNRRMRMTHKADAWLACMNNR